MNVVALRSEQPSLAKLWTKRSQTHMLSAYLMPLHGEALSKRMAAALKAKKYSYRYVFAKGAGHTDGKVTRQTLPEALEWLWKDYKAK